MSGFSLRLAPLTLFAALLAACGGATGAPTRVGGALGDVDGIEQIASFERMPSGVAVAAGSTFVAFPRWVEHGTFTLARLTDEGPVAFPSEVANDPAADGLVSVNGIDVDDQGRLWVLDNGRVDMAPAAAGVPKIVVFDASTGVELFRHVFGPEVAPGFANDIVYDDMHGFAYITDTGMGGSAGIVVYDVLRDLSWRVLDNHPALLPEADAVLHVQGSDVLVSVGGELRPWRVGANPIALSSDGRTLYFGALSSNTLWSIPTLALRDRSLADTERAEQIVAVGAKPYTDGMALDVDDFLWLTDWSGTAVERRCLSDLAAPGTVWTSDAFVLPIAVEPLGDGSALVSVSPLHELPMLHAGEDRRRRNFGLFRVGPHPSATCVQATP